MLQDKWIPNYGPKLENPQLNLCKSVSKNLDLDSGSDPWQRAGGERGGGSNLLPAGVGKRIPGHHRHKNLLREGQHISEFYNKYKSIFEGLRIR